MVSPEIDGARLIGTFSYDDQGSVIKMGIHSQPSTDSDSNSDLDLEFVRDQHGNWTECTRWVTKNGKREKNAMWKRTIVYR